MITRMIASALLAVSMIFVSANVQADVVTDDFSDGTLDAMWRVKMSANGLTVHENNDRLNISGTAVEPSRGFYGSVDSDLYLTTSDIVAQIKFQVPTASKQSGIGIILFGEKGSLELQYNTIVGYGLRVQDYGRNEWSPWLPKRGNETTEYNILKLAYDTNANTASAYVCDADGSNEQLVSSATVDLGDSCSVALNLWTQQDTTLDIRFDDFHLVADPYPAVVPPPLALGVSMGARQAFMPGDEDLSFPLFSNDGTKLAYLHRDDPNPANGVWNIYVKDLTNEELPYRITEDEDWVSIHHIFHWSPNDKRIFFLTEAPQGTEKIRYVDATETSDKISHPYWNTYDEFTGIHFTRTTNPKMAVIGRARNLYMIPVDDFGDPLEPWANARKITDLPHTGLYFPNSAPDGSKIVAAHGLAHGSLALWMIDLAFLGPGEMIINKDHPSVTLLTDYSSFAGTPYFSYDGKYVYFCKDMNDVFQHGNNGWNRYNPMPVMTGDADFDICVVKAEEGAPVERLNDDPLSQGILSASPDGTQLVYSTDDDTDGDGVRDGDLYIQSLVVGEPVPPSGGQVSDGSGTTVTIPDGALTEKKTITITTPVPGSEPPLDTLPTGTSLALARDFEPDGFWFEKAVTIQIHYTDEEIAGLDESNLQIYYYDDELGIWEALPKLPDGEGCTNTGENIICAKTDHFSTFAVLDVPYLMANCEIAPKALNRRSKGKYVTAYIELPAGFSPEEINTSSVMLNDTVAALGSPIEIGDHDGNGVPDCMVKFDRAAVQAALPLGWAPVKISGLLNSGMLFEDAFSIYVFEKGKDHTDEIDPDSIEE